MSTITPTITYAPEGHRNLVRAVWAGMTTGDVGAPVNFPSYPDGSVQIEGNFGTNATCTIQGSNEATPTHWETLTDPQGNNIAKTAAGIEQIEEVASWIRPSVTSGTSPAIDVTLTLRRSP